MPTGIPDHIFSFPEKYGGEQKGSAIPQDLLEEVANVSGVMDADISNTHFLDERIRNFCHEVLPEPEKTKSKDVITAYRYLKNNIVNF